MPPVGPAFGTVNTSVSEDGAVINWEYFGHHKNVYVEYIVENSKASLCICSHMYYSATTIYYFKCFKPSKYTSSLL